MLIFHGQKAWFILTVLLAVATLGSYFWIARTTPGGVTGGSIPGLIYAIVGTLMMIFAGLLSAVRKFPRTRLPPRKWWLKGHIWLGLLSGLLIACHSGWSWGGILEKILWAVFLIVLLTGIYGLALQQFLPRLLAARIPTEAPYEQIPYIVTVMRRKADALVQKVCSSPDDPMSLEGSTLHVSRFLNTQTQLQEFYEKQVRTFLVAGYDRSSPLANPLQAEAIFDKLSAFTTGGELHDLVDQLRSLCDERRLLGEQERLHHWLHSWLFVHIPLSVLLAFLTLAHAVIALYY
ncbi:MAG: hypothetical protein L0Z62_26845 [Gemmataceae bacterium]|nr:hypothetical protein [Gemmataceae bacterium]